MYASSNLAVARGVFAITPNDSTNLAQSARALYTGGGGTIKVLCRDGTSAEFINVPPGSILPVECVRVYATVASGTLATNIIGLI